MKNLMIGIALLTSALSFANNCEENSLKSEFDVISSEQNKIQKTRLITELTKNSIRAYNIAKSRALSIDGDRFKLPRIVFSIDENIEQRSEKQIFGFSETRKSSCAVSEIHTIDNSNKFFVKCASTEIELPLTLLRGVVVHF